MDWLMKIDPEWVVLLVGGLYAFYQSKKNGQTNQTLTDYLVGTFRQEYTAFYDNPDKRVSAEAYFEKLAWQGLAKVNVKKGKTTELVVKAAIAKALSELDRELRSRADLEAKLNQMLTSATQLRIPQANPIVKQPSVVMQEACGVAYKGLGSWCKRLPGHAGEHGEGD